MWKYEFIIEKNPSMYREKGTKVIVFMQLVTTAINIVKKAEVDGASG
jgi:hypothetical protein